MGQYGATAFFTGADECSIFDPARVLGIQIARKGGGYCVYSKLSNSGDLKC